MSNHRLLLVAALALLLWAYLASEPFASAKWQSSRIERRQDGRSLLRHPNGRKGNYHEVFDDLEYSNGCSSELGPALVHIFHDNKPLCVGLIISNLHVSVTEDCIRDFDHSNVNSFNLDGDRLVIVAGYELSKKQQKQKQHSLKSYEEGWRQYRLVDEIIKHPGGEQSNWVWFVLNRPLEFNFAIKPACDVDRQQFDMLSVKWPSSSGGSNGPTFDDIPKDIVTRKDRTLIDDDDDDQSRSVQDEDILLLSVDDLFNKSSSPFPASSNHRGKLTKSIRAHNGQSRNTGTICDHDKTSDVCKYVEHCGIYPDQTHNARHDQPFMVVVRKVQHPAAFDPSADAICGGIIISPHWVLTSRWCTLTRYNDAHRTLDIAPLDSFRLIHSRPPNRPTDELIRDVSHVDEIWVRNDEYNYDNRGLILLRMNPTIQRYDYLSLMCWPLVQSQSYQQCSFVYVNRKMANAITVYDVKQIQCQEAVAGYSCWELDPHGKKSTVINLTNRFKTAHNSSSKPNPRDGQINFPHMDAASFNHQDGPIICQESNGQWTVVAYVIPLKNEYATSWALATHVDANMLQTNNWQRVILRDGSISPVVGSLF